MKILLALPRPLFPADTGGKIRSLNILSRLVKRVEIHALSFADLALDAGAIPEMKAMFASYTPVCWKEAKRQSGRFYAELLISQLSPLPYFIAKCNRPEFTSAAKKLATQHRFDLMFCDFLHTAVPLREVPIKPRVVFEHNVEFLLRKRKWDVERHPLRKRIFGSEWRKTRTVEEQICRSFDHVLAVSPDDQSVFEKEFDVSNISTLPTGVDTDFFQPTSEAQRPGHMVFVGSMDWEPNEDGVVWFLREIYPRIRHAIPHASLSIVGRNPSSRLQAIAANQPAVEITGRIADVRPYLAEAAVNIVPLRIGGGTRIKIPEAMAMAKAVVSTPVGAEGLPFRDGRELCIAEQPEEFARAVVDLLKSGGLRSAIGTAARQEVTRNHGWEMVVDKTEAILRRVASFGNRASAA
jgi:sugar transferase (PEP-CTERM/EpsH1 system associated)